MAEIVRERTGKVFEGLGPIGGAKRRADEATNPVSSLRSVPRGFGRQHIAVVAVLCCLAALLTWWVLARTTETTLPVQAPVPVRVSEPGQTPSTPRQGLMVHVLGAVNAPGVIELPAGARVQAAIQSAGGLRADADAGQLNLAAQVVDGMQIVIGTKTEPQGEIRTSAGSSSGASGGIPAGKVSLNTASEEELQTLPGVGPATAKAILAWRSKHGRFTRVEELQEIDGIGPKTLAKLAGLVQV